MRCTRAPVRVLTALAIAAAVGSEAHLAEALRAVRAARVVGLDPDHPHRRHLGRGRDAVGGEVRVEHLALLAHEVLHEPVADALRGSALDLALGERRVDEVAAVGRRDEVDDADQAGLLVDLDLDGVRAKL